MPVWNKLDDLKKRSISVFTAVQVDDLFCWHGGDCPANMDQ